MSRWPSGAKGIQGRASCGCEGTYVTNTYIVCNRNCFKWRYPNGRPLDEQTTPNGKPFNPYVESDWFNLSLDGDDEDGT